MRITLFVIEILLGWREWRVAAAGEKLELNLNSNLFQTLARQ